MLPFPEVTALADEVRRLFDELDRARPRALGSAAAVYTPALDVVERPDEIEVYLDLAGVAAEDVRVLFKAGTLVMCGCKHPPEREPLSATAFHLVERGYGRFARAVQIAAAVDVSRARAALSAGELRVVVPKIEERRGRQFVIPIERDPIG